MKAGLWRTYRAISLRDMKNHTHTPTPTEPLPPSHPDQIPGGVLQFGRPKKVKQI